MCAWPPRHTLVVSGGSPVGPAGEAIAQGAGGRPGAWDSALPWKALLLVLQLCLQAWLPLPRLGPLLSRCFPNSNCLGSPSWEKIVTRGSLLWWPSLALSASCLLAVHPVLSGAFLGPQQTPLSKGPPTGITGLHHYRRNMA